MAFITAGMGGGDRNGRLRPSSRGAAREQGILTSASSPKKPFHFEGQRRMRVAEQASSSCRASSIRSHHSEPDLLFRIANEKTTFAQAFAMADEVPMRACAASPILMVIRASSTSDFADIRTVMNEMARP